MDILVIVDVWAIVLFLLGAFLLNICSCLERKDPQFFENLRNHYYKRKPDIIKPKALSDTLMTLTIRGLCLSGMILFVMHV